MCWSEEVSWLTFMIGSVTSLQVIKKHRENDPIITSIAFYFLYINFMQLWEALAWRFQDCNHPINKLASKGAQIFSISQPLVLGITLLFYLPSNKYVFWILNFIYLILLIHKLDNSQNNCISKREKCHHLTFQWATNKIDYIAYMILLFINMVILTNFNRIGIHMYGYILVTLFITNKWYRCEDDLGIVGSMWCWFGALGSLYLEYIVI